MDARVPQVMAQVVLKIEKLSHIMAPIPILEMAGAYGLRPRLWLLIYRYIAVSEEIERIQRRALRVIFPDCSYIEGLAKAGLTTLYDRRSTLYRELFSDIDTQGNRKLSHLLPLRSQQNYTV